MSYEICKTFRIFLYEKIVIYVIILNGFLCTKGIREKKGYTMSEQKRKPGRPPGSKNKKTASGGKTKGKTVKDTGRQPMNPNVKDDICGVVFIAVGIFLALAFQTHAAGAVGEALSDFFMGLFGFVAYIIPYYFVAYGVMLVAKKMIHIGRKSVILLCIILLMMTFLNSARFIDPGMLGFSLADASEYYHYGVRLEGGGLLGMYVGSLLVKAFGIPGLYIISILVIIICLLLIVNTPISAFFEKAKEKRVQRIEDREKREKEREKQREQEQKQLEIEMSKLPPVSSIEPVTEDKTETDENKKRFSFLKRLKEQGMEEPEPETPPAKAKPDLSKLNISDSQRNILEYMYDDDLFGENSNTDYGTGLDSYGESLARSNAEYAEQYDTDDEHIGFTDSGILSDGHADTEDYAEELPDGQIGFVTEAIPAGVIKKEPEKITNSQAAKAALDPKEINNSTKPVRTYKFPPVSLLNKGAAPKGRAAINAGLQAKAAKLEETLRNFNIDAKVANVTQGPAITRYEIHPNVGVKVKSIVSLADDIALNLEAKSIRIEAPIPGKAAVGIEVENDKINMVTIRDIIDTPEFKDAKSKITFAVGKDIAGNAITADLKGAPHLLIAGSTGSGKSVCVNSIITSILYKAKPEEVKLVLIDPKVVELTNYNGIPHLLIPVVTEPTKAAAALNWAVAEMEDRYKKFAESGVRELASYNSAVMKNGEEDKFLPQIVIIIDELADLMMAAPSQVEDSICRLAQKARAAGMHLIVATQRPSVDVITGVIKANIPSRIAFAVASQFDSRTILDMAGAEKLVGKGDMLLKIGGGKPVRVQGNFISDQEVNDVIEFVKGQTSETVYADDVISSIDKVGMPQTADDGDDLLPDAIETVVMAGTASASMLQRRFRIGYNRAARIIDIMEARGIIGPSEGSKPRQVLMTEEEFRGLSEDLEDFEGE